MQILNVKCRPDFKHSKVVVIFFTKFRIIMFQNLVASFFLFRSRPSVYLFLLNDLVVGYTPTINKLLARRSTYKTQLHLQTTVNDSCIGPWFKNDSRTECTLGYLQSVDTLVPTLPCIMFVPCSESPTHVPPAFGYSHAYVPPVFRISLACSSCVPNLPCMFLLCSAVFRHSHARSY